MGITASTWENQVPGQPDGAVGNGITYDSAEKAWRFVHKGNIMTVPISTTPQRMPDVTFSAWLKPLNLIGPSQKFMPVCQGPGSYGGNRALGLNDANQGVHVWCNHPRWPGGFQAPWPSVGEWNHVAAVYANGTKGSVYLDSVEYTLPHPCTSVDPSDDTGIYLGIGGKYNGDAGTTGDILISEVAVHNRALSPSEIAALYTAGRHYEASAHATGDPHCSNMLGDTFDIFATGDLTMLAVPRHGIAPGGDLLVKANIVPISSEACAPTIIDRVDIRGDRLKGMPPLSLVPGPGGVPVLPTEWLQGGDVSATITPATNGQASVRIHLGGHVRLSVSQRVGRETGVVYLDLQVQGLSSMREEIGGLLGLDRHDFEAKEAPGCDHTMKVRLNRNDIQNEHSNRLLSQALVVKSMGDA